MSETTLRRTLPEAYTIGLGGSSYLGLVGDGAGASYAVAYTGGEWTELLGSTSAFDVLDLLWSPLLVGDRYLVIVPSYDALLVWDLELAMVESYAPPSGWSVLGAGVLGTTVYWVERETVEHGSGPYATDVRLRSAGLDLATPTTVVTRSVSVSGGESTDSPLGTGAVVSVLLNEAAALVEWSWVDQVAEASGVVRVRLPLSGSSAQADAVGAALGELGLATAAGDAALVNRSGLLDGSLLLGFPDDVEGEPASLWPVTSGYALNPTHAALSVDGSAAVVYGTNTEDVRTLVRAPLSGAPSTPSERFAVGLYAEIAAPTYMLPRT